MSLLLLTFSSCPLSHNPCFLWFGVIFWVCIWLIFICGTPECSVPGTLSSRVEEVFFFMVLASLWESQVQMLTLLLTPRMGCSSCVHTSTEIGICHEVKHTFFFLICHSLFLAQVIAHFFRIPTFQKQSVGLGKNLTFVHWWMRLHDLICPQ